MWWWSPPGTDKESAVPSILLRFAKPGICHPHNNIHQLVSLFHLHSLVLISSTPMDKSRGESHANTWKSGRWSLFPPFANTGRAETLPKSWVWVLPVPEHGGVLKLKPW